MLERVYSRKHSEIPTMIFRPGDRTICDDYSVSHFFLPVNDINPDKLEPIMCQVVIGPPWQRIFCCAQVLKGTLVTMTATIIIEAGHKPTFDPRLLEFMAERMEEAPSFILLRDEGQHKLRQFLQGIEAEFGICESLRVGVIRTYS